MAQKENSLNRNGGTEAELINLFSQEDSLIFDQDHEVQEMPFKDPYEGMFGTGKPLPDREYTKLEKAHNYMMVAGFYPVYGIPFDIADGILYYGEAATSAYKGVKSWIAGNNKKASKEFKDSQWKTGMGHMSMVAAVPAIGALGNVTKAAKVARSSKNMQEATANAIVKNLEEVGIAGEPYMVFRRIPRGHYDTLDEARSWVANQYSSKASYIKFKQMYGLNHVDNDILYPIYKKEIINNINDPVFRISDDLSMHGSHMSGLQKEGLTLGQKGKPGLVDLSGGLFTRSYQKGGISFDPNLSYQQNITKGVKSGDILKRDPDRITQFRNVATHELTHSAQVGGAFTGKLGLTYDGLGYTTAIFTREPLLVRIGNTLQKSNPSQFNKYIGDLETSLSKNMHGDYNIPLKHINIKTPITDPHAVSEVASNITGSAKFSPEMQNVYKNVPSTRKHVDYVSSWWETSARVSEIRHMDELGVNWLSSRAYGDLRTVYGPTHTKELIQTIW